MQNKIQIRLGLPVPEEHFEVFFSWLQLLVAHENVNLFTVNQFFCNLLLNHGIRSETIGHFGKMPYEKVGTLPKIYDFAYLGQVSDTKGFSKFIECLISLAKIGIHPKSLVHARNSLISDDLKNFLKNVNWHTDEVNNEDWSNHIL